MKSPQSRSSPIRIAETTRIKSGIPEFVIESKHLNDTTYTQWARITTRDGVETVRDILQYTLASISESEPMPSRYDGRKPLSDRSSGFTESHTDFKSKFEEPITVKAKSGSPEFVAVFYTVAQEAISAAPVWFHSPDQIRTMIDACDAWLNEHNSES